MAEHEHFQQVEKGLNVIFMTPGEREEGEEEIKRDRNNNEDELAIKEQTLDKH